MMNDHFIDDVKLITFSSFWDERGGLSVVQGYSDFPFEIARVFYTYGTDPKIGRGSHAHKACWQMLICLNGQMEVEVDDSVSNHTYVLDKPNLGLLVPPQIWSRQFGYSEACVCLVLASEIFSENDYIRDFDEFRILRGE